MIKKSSIVSNLLNSKDESIIKFVASCKQVSNLPRYNDYILKKSFLTKKLEYILSNNNDSISSEDAKEVLETLQMFV